ncbi:unnamed protein product [Effrenium voratum]|nr:unnamed protein product [Effrenium voratum]
MLAPNARCPVCTEPLLSGRAVKMKLDARKVCGVTFVIARCRTRSARRCGREKYPLMTLRNRQRTPLEFLDDASRLDPYAVLGIPFLSGRRAIRQAYANCCREHHPDLNGGRESLEWMMIQRAYRILTVWGCAHSAARRSPFA